MRRSIAVALSLLLLGGTAFAKQDRENGKGKSKKEKQHKKEKGKQQKGKASKDFSQAEKRTVQHYYRHLPPGLAKKYKRTGTLPPAWEKNVNIGHKLPESYKKELQPVPTELKETLEVGPVGSEVMRMGNKIIRLEQATNMILDVFEL